MKRLLQNYCKQTSLHGFFYITDENLARTKRTLWLIFCLGSITLCVLLIYLQLAEFETHRINTSIASTAYPIWEVPFPAVTICNFNVVYKDNVHKIAKSLFANGFANTTINAFFTRLNALVDVELAEDDINLQRYKHIVEYLQGVEYDSDRMMRELTQPCRKMLKRCFWKTKEINCGTLFRRTKSSNGYCCSFNYLGEIDDDEIIDDEDVFIAGGLGLAFGLKVYLDAETSEYVSSRKKLQGFDVSIHDTYDYPIMSLHGISIMPGDDVTITIRPQILQSSDNVRSLDLKTRRCLFNDERAMQWSRYYSYITCFTECKGRAIYNICECMPFVYHSADNVKFCSLLDIPCLKQNAYRYNNLAISDTFVEESIRNARKKVKDAIHCNCYPQCNQVSYDDEFDVKKATVNNGHSNLSVLNIYYNRIGCTKITRDIYMTWNSVIAAIGGIFGLCLGGSVMSLIELFFHVFHGVVGIFVSPFPRRKNMLISLSDFKNHKKNQNKILPVRTIDIKDK